MQALPRHYRQVLSLRLVHGLELQQIAHSLDVPLGTVKVRLHRGLAMLRRTLPVGLTASVAVLATPSFGLAAARQAVLAEAAAACGTAGAAGAAVILGGWMMKKLVLGAAAIALAVGGWFTFGPVGAATPVTVAPEVPA
ncbi:MAG TPA: sigma-70 family RNA polymerase sigma factor, partial [Planctomycetota bacterium]|nr:sigma-70 family RNA polymerase sigma factor [Planctomycetota bacterium]